jgi:type II secretory pathway predicted ATPase ExeA
VLDDAVEHVTDELGGAIARLRVARTVVERVQDREVRAGARIIDEAQEMLTTVFNELRILTSKSFDSEQLLCVVFAGDARQHDRLRHVSAEPFEVSGHLACLTACFDEALSLLP